ncbi:MAG: hypothetical protein QOH12_1030 [Solirubrobacteraceae bacterium]|jgi:hypothetical protein|nr:hypothetical protein [Solirubrobacteraceae bacterium]
MPAVDTCDSVAEVSEERSVRHLAGAAWRNLGTAVAVIEGSVLLAFTLWPGLAPDPGTIQAASVSVETVDSHVSLYHFDQYYPAQLKSLTSRARRQAKTAFGSVVYLQVKIQGKKHGNVTLSYVSYDSATRSEIPDSGGVSEGFQPNNPSDEWIAPVFVFDPVPPPSAGLPPKHFFVRLRLFDGNVLLAFADTPQLTRGG